MYPDNYFTFIMKLYKAAGYYEPKRSAKRNEKLFYVLYNALIITICPIYFTTVETVMLRYTIVDLNTFIDHAGMLLIHMAGSLKIYMMITKRNMLKRIMKTLQSEDFQYEDYEDFQPGKIIAQHSKQSELMCKMFLFLGAMVPISNQVSSFYKYFMHGHLVTSGNLTCQYILPYYSWTFFDTESEGACGAALIIQTIPLLLFVPPIVSYDTSFTYLALFLRGHFLCLREAFRTVRPRCLRRLQLPENLETTLDEENLHLEKEIKKEMRKMSYHSQTIIGICDELENFYAFPLLVQTLSTLGILVTCLYIISIEPLFSSIAYSQIQFAMGVLFQFGMYCVFGNEVTFMALSVTDGIYSSNWYYSTKSTKSTMLINMQRLQKPIYFSVGKFSPLTLSTYLTIIKGSYSYYTFLSSKK